VVSDAISIIEKSAIETIGKHVELTVDKIRELGIAPPEMIIVDFAIEQLKKTLADISDGISFLSLIGESRRLQEKVHDLQRKISLEDKALSQSIARVEFIHTVHAMEGQRKAYASEYEKAVAAFKRYLATVDANNTADLTEAKKQANQFIGFLAPLTLP
jgi:hypothetical protein